MDINPGSIEVDDAPGAQLVLNALKDTVQELTGDIGYKTPSCGVANVAHIPSFVGLSRELGIFFIDVVEETIVEATPEKEDWWTSSAGLELPSRDVVCSRFQSEVINRLSKDSALYDRKARNAKVPIRGLIVFAQNSSAEVDVLKQSYEFIFDVVSAEQLESGLEEFLTPTSESLKDEVFDRIYAVLETTSVFERIVPPTKKTELRVKADFIREALQTTFKLDQAQRQVALQVPDGPQRIRGLAGTGKTVILSLKAALAHKIRPDFNILFLFNTQSMYGTINDFISKYYTAETRTPIDETRLRIRHAWGGVTTREGLYLLLCKQYGIKPLTLNDVRGAADTLEVIYGDLLTKAKDRFKREFDLVLIDEAQDFPPVLFEVIHYVTKPPFRIIWAYDEFQSLKELRIAEPEEMFGKKSDGSPNFTNAILDGKYSGLIDKDFILPNSYRNPRQPLMIAHGFALGLRRQAGIVDVFPDRRSWEAIGYIVKRPANAFIYRAGDQMEIERPDKFSRNRLEQLLKQSGKADQVVNIETFPTKEVQLQEIAGRIVTDIRDEKVDPSQILVVTLETRRAKDDLGYLRKLLNEAGVSSVMPGLVESSSTYRVPECVTLTTPFRAKGNEAHVVYVINCQQAVRDASFRGRNSLFVAITRTQGWCYLSGYGEAMQILQNEFNDLMETYPCFEFEYPSQEALRRTRSILARSDKELARQEDLLDQILESNPDLLIEKLKSTPDILDKLKR